MSPKKRQKAASVMPVVRWAALARITPPPREQVEAILEALTREWEKCRDEYICIVSEAAGVRPTYVQLVETESVRPHRDGKTPVIDFPRVRAHDPRRKFDTRLCMAICTDNLSSKVWSRVGMISSDSHYNDAKLRRVTLRSQLELFRTIAKASATWGREFLASVLRQEFPALSLEHGVDLEVSVMGTDDEAVAPLLERLANSEMSAEELLDESGARATIAEYYKDGLASDANVGNILDEEEDAFWFSSPTTVLLESGDYDTREVLYLMRQTDEAAQVLGLGFDGNAHRTLAQQSALKVSRWIANRI